MTATPQSSSAPAGNPAPPAVPVDRRVVIKCAGLTKIFKDFWMRPRVRAVNNIDLDVYEGEVFGLLGPNGSGKSTTIKIILGLLHPSAGRVAVLGRRPEDVETKKDIGYLPEESYLYRFLNARETLDYYGRLFHQPRRTRRTRIDMLLEMVGLEAAQNRPVGEYSKGMQRRIGIAQALINDPKLLILDEPTTGMDPIGTRQIKDLLIRLRERGKTILLCSHLLADVQDVCDRVSIMFGGKVVANGTLDELLVDEHTTTLQTDDLDDETIQQIESVLQQHGKHIGKVSRPRQSLEQKFLDLVHQEQERGSETSGARSGGKIAGFLMDDERSGHMPEDVEAEQLLSQLTTPTAPEPARQPDGGSSHSGPPRRPSKATDHAADLPADPGAAPDQADPAVDQADLGVLAELSQSRPSPTDTAGTSAKGDAEDDVDRSVIDGLLTASPTPSPAPVSEPEPVSRTSADLPTDETVVAGDADAHADTDTDIDASAPGTIKDNNNDTNNNDDNEQSDAVNVGTREVEVDAAPPDVARPGEAEAIDSPKEQAPPPPLVSKPADESGTNLADAVEIDDAVHDLVKPPIPVSPEPAAEPQPDPDSEPDSKSDGQASEFVEAASEPEESQPSGVADPSNTKDTEDAEEPRVSPSGETPDQGFIEELKKVDPRKRNQHRGPNNP